MKYYKKRIIQFTAFGLIGFCLYNFGLRFIEPITQAENTVHTIASVTTLLLGVLGFFGAAVFAVGWLFSDK